MFGMGILPPKELMVDGRNSFINWNKFKEDWSKFEIATRLVNMEKEVRVTTFLALIGAEARKLLNTFTWNKNEHKYDIQQVIHKYDEYFRSNRQLTYNRYIFNTRTQHPYENISEYVNELSILSDACEFGYLKSSLIRDRVVVGMCDNAIREALLREPDISLENVVQIIKNSEQNKKLELKQPVQENKKNDIVEDEIEVINDVTIKEEYLDLVDDAPHKKNVETKTKKGQRQQLKFKEELNEDIFVEEGVLSFNVVQVSPLSSECTSPGLVTTRPRRVRIFIDSETEVPVLEHWLSSDCYPNPDMILNYTNLLNQMPYRQMYPKLTPQNVRWWFKNRRARCRRQSVAKLKHSLR